MTKKKKVVLNRDFYVDEIGVLDWMYDENQYQKIRLERNGHYVYKYNNELHRTDGPAIEKFEGTGDAYYINGKRVTFEDIKPTI